MASVLIFSGLRQRSHSADDHISKFADHDDYAINDIVFNALDDLWGLHTCDGFACPFNAKSSVLQFQILLTRFERRQGIFPRLASK